MKKPWLGYLSPALFLLAGVLMIVGKKLVIGIAFLVLALVSLVITHNLNKKSKDS